MKMNIIFSVSSVTFKRSQKIQQGISLISGSLWVISQRSLFPNKYVITASSTLKNDFNLP